MAEIPAIEISFFDRNSVENGTKLEKIDLMIFHLSQGHNTIIMWPCKFNRQRT